MNHLLWRQLASTTIAPSGFSERKNSSMASLFRRGFQLAHISEPSTRMVGRRSASERCESVCASSIHAMLEALQALDALGRVILHALKDDEPVAGRFDAVVEDAEERAYAEGLDLRSR